MSINESTKNLQVSLLYIAIGAGENIAQALRGTLTAIKYANVQYGEDHYQDFLRKKGHQFKKQAEFIRVANELKESDIECIAVTKKDKEIIKNNAIKYGMDFTLLRKPNDLEKLIEKRYIKNETISSYEEQLIRSFTFRDDSGKTIMNPEKPKMPLVNDAEYVLTICSKDIKRWEIVCREMERKTHKYEKMKDRITNAKQTAILFNKKLQKDKVKNIERGHEK